MASTDSEIFRLSHDLAITGRYRDFADIELHLRVTGIPGVFLGPRDKMIINEICERAYDPLKAYRYEYSVE